MGEMIVPVSMEKRSHVYVQRPKHFEISGCPKCGSIDTQWSEYRDRLWCPACEHDFQPACWGILDGPVGVQVCRLLGLDFRMMNIETGKVFDPTISEGER